MSEDKLATLVLAYKKSRKSDALADVVVEAEKYVKSICGRVTNTVPTVLDQSDLVQYGYMGLLSAVESWIPERNPNFKAYAFARVMGSAKDAIRSASSVSRQRNVHFQSLDKVHDSTNGEGSFLDVLADKSADYQLESVDIPRLGLPEAIHDAIRGLTDRQAFIILTSIHGLSLKQISLILELSTTRVSQERRHAQAKIREMLLERVGRDLEGVNLDG